jgi:transcriptional regulator with XRE-family HTH domain
MSTRERPVDRAIRIADADRLRAASEIRDARVAAGASLASVAVAARVSPSQARRIERGAMPNVSHHQVARVAAAVGLDARLRLYPGPDPIRDAGHVRLIERLRARLGAGLILRMEVPLPIDGDPRALDAVLDRLIGLDRRLPVEVETRISDLQAQYRRLMLKVRDAGFEHLLLVVADTRRNREAVRAAPDLLRVLFPVSGRNALAALREGRHPGGSALVLL